MIKLQKWTLGLLGLVVTALVLWLFFGMPSINNSPGDSASGQSILAFMSAHTDASYLAVYVVLAASAALVVYGAVLWQSLRAITRQRVLPAVVFGGAVVFAAGAADVLVPVVALLQGARNGMPASAAQALNVWSDANPIAVQFGAAILVGATGLVLLTSSGGVWVRWVLGVVSVVIATLLALNPAALLPFLAWLVVTGFVVGIKAARPAPAAAPMPASLSRELTPCVAASMS